MPTLFRFLTVLAMIGAAIYGSMIALTVFVVPREREVTVRIPSERLNPPKTGQSAEPGAATAP